MKKILLTICCLVLISGCSLSENFALIESNVEQEPEVQEYQYNIQAYQRRYEEEERQRRQREQEKYNIDKEQEAKYKHIKEEWDKFIQSGNGSIKNKTTQEVKKLVDQWEQEYLDKAMAGNIEKIREVFSLENFYKLFGKPWKMQFISNFVSRDDIFGNFVSRDSYILWYICKGGYVQIIVSGYEYDDGWVNILDLNIL